LIAVYETNSTTYLSLFFVEEKYKAEEKILHTLKKELAHQLSTILNTNKSILSTDSEISNDEFSGPQLFKERRS